MTYPNGKTESLLPKRLAILDIETTSLDAMTGRVACIGLLFDNAVNLQTLVICEQDEKKLLERFWTAITENDLLIGHNILEFDLMFIRQRSWILGVKPPLALNLKKYYTDQVVDLMALWTNWSYKYKGAGLDNIAQALGLGSKTGHGSEVAGMWDRGEYVKVMDYCMSDVWLTYQVYCKMHFREPLGAPIPKFTQPEPVYVMAQQKGPVPTVNGSPAPMQVNPVEASVPQTVNSETRRRSAPRISYLKMGGALILAGSGTFNIKEQLSGIGGRSHKDKNSGKWTWEVPEAKFNELAGLCAQTGVRLVPADGTLSLPRGA